MACSTKLPHDTPIRSWSMWCPAGSNIKQLQTPLCHGYRVGTATAAKMLFSWINVLLSIAFVATAAPTTLVISLPPLEDPFYTAPKGFEDASPGEILRVRIAPGNLTTLVTNSSQAYHILFRTTDSRYQPSWAVTTLFAPQSDSGSSDALLSYQASCSMHSST